MYPLRNWKPTLIVFAILVTWVVYNGWLLGSVLFATLLLLGGAIAISANQLPPGWYLALVVVVVLISPGMLGLFLVAGGLCLGYLIIKRIAGDG